METPTQHSTINFRGVGIFVPNNEALMGRLQVRGLLYGSLWREFAGGLNPC